MFLNYLLEKKLIIFYRCKLIKYEYDLPTASVIFIFKNERWSVVLRSIYSIVNRSPRHLLKEIILVDDQSELEELKKPLDDYCEGKLTLTSYKA
jgi:polypeptide N-acetylgalactosaminyltransferase